MKRGRDESRPGRQKCLRHGSPEVSAAVISGSYSAYASEAEPRIECDPASCRIVVRLLYLELCKKCRADAMQYCIVRFRRPIDAAMLSRNASPSVKLKSAWASSE